MTPPPRTTPDRTRHNSRPDTRKVPTEHVGAAAGMGELREKVARCHRILDRAGAHALVLESHGAMSWLLDGARLDVGAGGQPVARAVVHRDGVTLGAFANEVDRLREEQLPPTLVEGLGLDLVPVDWHASLDPAMWWRGPAAHLLTEAQAADSLAAARASLLPAELQRYRSLGQDAAGVLTDVLTDIRLTDRPVGGPTERELAAEVHRRTVGIGADPVVVLVAGAPRLQHRHPSPTDGSLAGRAMLVLCARRAGMITNLTRWAGAPDDAEAERALLEVEADALDVLAPGVALAAVLGALVAAYPRHGFAPDEWTRHHQGGPAGYLGRDPRLVPGVHGVVDRNQAFALNPSVPGHKVEDTVLVTDRGVEVLTRDARWPTTEVHGRPRPLHLPG